MREGSKRQERGTARQPASVSSHRAAPFVRWCVGALICWFAFGDAASQADDFQHELAAARLVEISVFGRLPQGPRTPEDRAALENLGRIFERLVARNPKNPEAHSAYAGYLLERGDGRALAEWRAAQSLDPRNAGVASELGGCYLALGEEAEALRCFALASRLEPGNAGYHFDLGNTTFMLRHELSASGGAAEQNVMGNALAEFRRASELAPFNREYARAYAETFYGLQNPDWLEALKAWMHFLDLKGPPDFCHENLARVNLKLGRTEAALGELSKVTRADFGPVKRHLLEEAKTQAASQ